MQQFLLSFPVLLLSLAATSLGQGQSGTPADQYASLLKEYDQASSSGVPLTDAERLKFVGEAYQHRHQMALKFLELVENNPNDPIALAALTKAVWQVNTTPWPVELVGVDSARGRAFELLLRDHIRSDKLGPLCQRVSYGFCEEYETFLRAVLADNPHKDVQGTACLALARYLNHRLERLDLCKDQPQLGKEFAELYGKEYFATLQKQERGDVVKEVEFLLERAADQYGASLLPDGGAIAERAEAELMAIRQFSVGKMAPDIEGIDQERQRFKLSDYRGKVVLLDFWSFV